MASSVYTGHAEPGGASYFQELRCVKLLGKEMSKRIVGDNATIPMKLTDAPTRLARRGRKGPTQPFPTKPPPFARQSFTERDINPYITEAEQAMMRQEFKMYRKRGALHAAQPARIGSDAGE
jgi:hypothetical protein